MIKVQIVGDVQRLVLKPGDKVIVTVPQAISVETARQLAEILKARLDGHDVIVLGDGAKLSVVEP